MTHGLQELSVLALECSAWWTPAPRGGDFLSAGPAAAGSAGEEDSQSAQSQFRLSGSADTLPLPG